LPSPGDDTFDSLYAARQAAEALAVDVLWALSGRQFGVCDYIVRPCLQFADIRYNRSVVTSYVLSWEGSHWLNWPCGCGGVCRLSGPRAVHLPGPAQQVVDVVINGAPLSLDQYVLEGDVLYRKGAPWPVQDLGRPMGEPGTWSVEYLKGNPVPAAAALLTGILAKEFIAACDGGKCRLPATTRTVTRQGLSYELFDASQILSAGKTGLREIDLWLSAINPHRLLYPSSVI